MKKQELRELMVERIASVSAKDRAAESRSVCRRLIKEMGDAENVCVYSALATEVDLTLLIENLFKTNCNVYLPRFEGGKNVFRRVKSIKELAKGSFGIPEPPVSGDALPSDCKIIAIVPGRAFDRSGNRLGRGNGGYDHWIREMRDHGEKAQFWGVCFECQIVQNIPVEPHDEQVDAIFTARGNIM